MSALQSLFKATQPFLTKSGARHGKKDKDLVQKAHDSVAMLADCAHCGKMDAEGEEMAAKAARIEKAGARHSSEDMGRIEKAHDLLRDLGALCPGPGTPMGALDPKEDDEAE